MLRCLFLLCLLLPFHALAEETLSPAQLGADLAAIRQHLAEIHPDPGFAGQGPAIDAAFSSVARQLTRPMTRTEAWRVMATLNPAFADAHMQVMIPEAGKRTRAHLAAGGKLFPFEVQAGNDGALRIRSALGGGATPYAGARILRINGVATPVLMRGMLARLGGDTAALRTNMLSWRMWLTYWQLFGAPDHYNLALAGRGAVRVPASAALPESMSEGFEQDFQFELLGGGAALLTLNSFIIDDKARFLAFTADAFTRLKAAGARVLIIDVRRNGGGDDVHWKEGILPYLATAPYRHTSAYVKKVIAGRESAEEALGSVLRAAHDKWEQPDLANPLRFTGQVYVLTGRMSYSSTILFANVMQDFGFGKLVGEPGSARTRQSGGVQYRTLPHTGLELVLPRFILERPAGPRAAPLLAPDVVLADDPFRPRALVTALLAWHRDHAH